MKPFIDFNTYGLVLCRCVSYYRCCNCLAQELDNLGATLAGVLETHFHADFVSGHLELQKRFNVPIYFGPGSGSRAQFALQEVQDGEVRLQPIVGTLVHIVVKLYDVMWMLWAITKFRKFHYPLNIASKSATPPVTPLSQFAIY